MYRQEMSGEKITRCNKGLQLKSDHKHPTYMLCISTANILYINSIHTKTE